VTMTESAVVTPQGMAVALLVCAVVAGIGQLFRLTLAAPLSRSLGSLQAAVLIPWLVLYVFITVRLASVLGLGA